MIELKPTVCNICGGKVEYIDIRKVYGYRTQLKYDSSGFCYRCKNCGALVGTHKDRPDEAMGLLANREMSEMRIKAHKMFDKFWMGTGKSIRTQVRTDCYERLAEEMKIPVEECHFAYFTMEQLEQAYSILCRWWREKYDR